MKCFFHRQKINLIKAIPNSLGAIVKKILIHLLTITVFSCSRHSPTRISPLGADSLSHHQYAIFLDINIKNQERNHSPLQAKVVAIESSENFDSNSITLNEFKKAKERNKKIIICCAKEKTSIIAKKISKRGVEVFYFEDINNWTKAGLPIKKIMK